jgi:hypothetical protein
VNSNNPQPIISYDGHTSNVTSVGFQKDGKWMYSGSEDGTGEAGCHGGGLGDQERKGTGAPISVPAVGTEAGVCAGRGWLAAEAGCCAVHLSLAQHTTLCVQQASRQQLPTGTAKVGGARAWFKGVRCSAALAARFRRIRLFPLLAHTHFDTHMCLLPCSAGCSEDMGLEGAWLSAGVRESGGCEHGGAAPQPGGADIGCVC